MAVALLNSLKEAPNAVNGRWRQHLSWMVVPALIMSLEACSQEAIRDHKVTPAPTSPAAGLAVTQASEQKVQPPAAPAPTTAPSVAALGSPPVSEVKPPAAPAVAEPPAAAPAAGVALAIGVTGDTLQFDKSTFTVKAGAPVVLTFKNGSTVFQHNWVLVQSGAKDAVATAGATAGPTNGWIPASHASILARSGLLNPGAIEEVRFTAPSAGNYQFVCTFPGHNFTMFGDFKVSR